MSKPKGKPQPQFGAPITIPREYLVMLNKLNKAATSLGIATDYLQEVAQEIQRLGVEKHQEEVNLAKVSEKEEEAHKKRDEKKEKT